MKKIYWLVVVVAAMFFNTGCGNKSKVNFSKPESVAKAYFEALTRLDFEGAKQYGTKDTKDVLDMLKSMMDVLDEEQKKQALADLEKNKVQKVMCKATENGEQECSYCCDEAGKFMETPVHLVKEEGRWLVDIPKEEMMKEMQNAEGADDGSGN